MGQARIRENTHCVHFGRWAAVWGPAGIPEGWHPNVATCKLAGLGCALVFAGPKSCRPLGILQPWDPALLPSL